MLRHTPTLLLPPPECTAAASERGGAGAVPEAKIKNKGEEIMFRGGERREPMRWVKENREGEKIMFPESPMRVGAVRSTIERNYAGS